jgi:hypothetical protein
MLFLSAVVPSWSTTHINILKFNHIIKQSAFCNFVNVPKELGDANLNHTKNYVALLANHFSRHDYHIYWQQHTINLISVSILH